MQTKLFAAEWSWRLPFAASRALRFLPRCRFFCKGTLPSRGPAFEDEIRVKGDSGSDNQVDVHIVWDAEPRGNIRVIGSIDDGGWRAFVPITDAFILAPDGSFVGE